MELVFKDIRGKKNVGDLTWIHSSGKQSIIVDMVSGSDVELGLNLINNYLHENQNENVFDASKLIASLNLIFIQNHVQAVIGVITKINNILLFNVVGNLRLYKVKDSITVSKFINLENQPTSVIGYDENLPVNHFQIEIEDNELYVLTTDGVSIDLAHNSNLRYTSFQSGSLHSLFLPYVKDQDWSVLVFPLSKLRSFSDDSWPYNPFIGTQEDRPHERRGLSEIATELFNSKHFEGFRIVSSPPILKKESSLLFDGLIVHPFGVLPIELKDHHGEIVISMDSKSRESFFVKNDIGNSQFTNPVHKMRDGLRIFGDLQALGTLIHESKRNGLIVFTSSLVDVKCLYRGKEWDTPFIEAGEVIVAKTDNLVEALLRLYKRTSGKKLKPKLSDADINRIVKSLTDLKPSFDGEKVLIGDYECSTSQIVNESSDYYQIFQAWSYDEPLWAKCFTFDQLGSLERQAEIQSLGREAQTLNRLGRHRIPGIQYCYGKEVSAEKLYVFLESAPEQDLQDWLDLEPSRNQKIEMLINIAKILKGIQSAGGQQKIIHRAINPHNIRVDELGAPVLINFELCQIETVATLPINARRTFEHKYQADEVNSPGKELTYSADIYSLGLIAVEMLTEELPFKESPKEILMKGRRRGFWPSLCQNMGIPGQDVEFIQRILHLNEGCRPNIDLVIETFKEWKQ